MNVDMISGLFEGGFYALCARRNKDQISHHNATVTSPERS
jgi:hypothetical protein